MPHPLRDDTPLVTASVVARLLWDRRQGCGIDVRYDRVVLEVDRIAHILAPSQDHAATLHGEFAIFDCLFKSLAGGPFYGPIPPGGLVVCTPIIGCSAPIVYCG